jgi:hypothetical protein
LLSLNFSRLLDQTDKFTERLKWFSIGGEFKISQPLRLRFGFDNRIRDNVPSGQSKGLSGLAAGFGVVVKDYRFDYGFNSLAPLGGNHRITLNAMF